MARIVAAAAIVATGLGLATAPVAAVAPTVSVTPSTGLLDEHRVAMSATGLDAGTEYVFVECAGDACVDPRLYLDPTEPSGGLPRAGERAVIADAQGDATIVTDIWRRIPTGDPSDVEEVDCSAAPCDVAVVRRSDLEVIARTPVAFAPTGTYTWREASIEVAAPVRLAHLGPVDVTGSGFDPLFAVREPIAGLPPYEWPLRSGALVRVCAVPRPGERGTCQSVPGGWLAVTTDGTVDAQVRVPRFVDAGELWDCARRACELVLTQAGDPSSNGAPIPFGPEWSPFASAAAMVDAFMGALHVEEPAPGDRQVLVDDLDAELIDAATVLETLAHVPHAGLDVAGLYGSILGARPDAAGFLFWRGQRLAGTSAGRVAEVFANTPAVRAWSEVGSASAAVTSAYQRILGRAADAAGRDYWVARLAGGMPRYRMVASMARTNEARHRVFHRAAVSSAMVALLGRGPTLQEWNAVPVAPGGDLSFVAFWPIVGSPQVRVLAGGSG